MHAALIKELKKHITLTAEEEELITASFRYKKVRRNQVLVQPPDVLCCCFTHPLSGNDLYRAPAIRLFHELVW